MGSDDTSVSTGAGRPAADQNAGRRRKPRRRSSPAQGSAPTAIPEPNPAIDPAPASAPVPTPDRRTGARRARADRRTDPADRQWRELAGAGRSQVSLSAALRARDADQPTAEELTEAERTMVIQRRKWAPTPEG